MRPLLLISCVLIPTLAMAGHRPPPPPPPPLPVAPPPATPALHKKLTALLTEAATLEGVASNLQCDPRAVQDLRARLAGMRQELAALVAAMPAPVIVVAPQPAPPPVPPPVEKPPGPVAMAEPAFGKVVAGIRKQGFSDGKLNVLKSASAKHFFTVRQVATVVALFSFSDDKLAAVSAMNPRIVDRENLFELYDVFTFEADKTRLKQIVEDAE